MQEKLSEKVQERVFGALLRRPENLECADCTSKGPCWVSIDYGVFICMNCAGSPLFLIGRCPSSTRAEGHKSKIY